MDCHVEALVLGEEVEVLLDFLAEGICEAYDGWEIWSGGGFGVGGLEKVGVAA